MHTVKAPSREYIVEGTTVFLAGTIDDGRSDDWQGYMMRILARRFDEITIFNPRRDDWGSSWGHTFDNKELVDQINWELDHLEKADYIFMYFAPNSKSPISLLELGAFAQRGNMIVCCPPEFYRSGNVEVFCTRYGVQLFHNLYDARMELEHILDRHEPALKFITE